MLKATKGTDTVYYTRGFELISRREGTAASYYLYDGGLSVRALTNESGVVTDTLVFDAFGNETGRTGTTDNSYGFHGEERDDTGLYYLRARYMDPSTGTFTSMDTYSGSLSDPVSLHKYLFANANPVMYSDPSGRYTLTETETAIAIQGIIGEAMSGIFYMVDWFVNDPDSNNHSIPDMILSMMLGLLQGMFMGSWGGYLAGLVAKAGLTTLDYILTGIVFALFGGNLKLEAIKQRDANNNLIAAICDAFGDLAGCVSISAFVCSVSSYTSSRNTSNTEVQSENNQGDSSNSTRPRRDQYMGRTPGKASRTGRETIERMRGEGLIRDNNGVTEFYSQEGEDWFPLSEGDMAHKQDCVRFWNEEGRFTGARSQYVRSWMLDSENYYIEHYHYNRSAGARIRQTYLPPVI